MHIKCTYAKMLFFYAGLHISIYILYDRISFMVIFHLLRVDDNSIYHKRV